MNNRYIIDWDGYAKCARKAVAEGSVLLRNEKDALPLKKGEKIALFGRIQLSYYKSGTGSGGLVNTKYVVSILDALKEEDLHLNEELLACYEKFCEENPFDMGEGWAKEPWCQKEMPLLEEQVERIAAESDKAIIIIGRSSGEDKDASATKGSFLLTEEEEHMLYLVTKHFEKTIVLLNVGAIMDMQFVEKYGPEAVLYVWQGGMEGGHGVLDVLMGRVCPSGRLTDTIAKSIQDYPSTECFGNPIENYYKEDIYVGYRYFETFDKDAVLYPFGFGLSYTSFQETFSDIILKDNVLTVTGKVQNIGEASGRQVVQIYLKAPQGKLGKPARVLIGFYKTKELQPGEAEAFSLKIDDYVLASYDDSGSSGYPFSYVMEQGTYVVYGGKNVRAAVKIGEFNLQRTIVVKTHSSALAPVKEYKRLRPKVMGGGSYAKEWEAVPTRGYSLKERMANEQVVTYQYTGDFGYKLADVYDRKVSMGTFLSQLSDKDLRCLVRGEGMCSSKVTPGTASAFGGVTKELEAFGIPAGCCADGPSGIRMDCGTQAFSLPNGTCLACTFDVELNQKLYTYTGAELRKNRVDTLLGPGMNIHRNPLNGRNFEYFSEDPLLTGKMAAAQLKGMHEYGVTGTIKHFATNNQEYGRRESSAVVSERALREIYLKGFEIAVKEADAYSIMTTYGAINGIWTASNYDLLITILRNEWNYSGMVMTDWWAVMNEEGKNPSIHNLKEMVMAGNDVYMVTADAVKAEEKDNLKQSMKEGSLTRGVLQRSAANILNALMRMPTLQRKLDRISDLEREAMEQLDDTEKELHNLTYIPMEKELIIDGQTIDTTRGQNFLLGIESSHVGLYELRIKLSVDAVELAQVPVTIYGNGILHGTHTLRGTNGESIELVQDLGCFINKYNFLKLYFGQSGIQIEELKITLTEEIKGTIWEV